MGFPIYLSDTTPAYLGFPARGRGISRRIQKCQRFGYVLAKNVLWSNELIDYGAATNLQLLGDLRIIQSVSFELLDLVFHE